MSKFLALFAYRKVHETSTYKTVVWLIITFKNSTIFFNRKSYLQFSTSLGIWNFKV